MTGRNYQGPERRKHKRIKKQFSVNLCTSKEGEPDRWDIVLVRNIGAGGVLFRYDRPFETGDVLKFKINMGLDREPIQCRGKVVRVKSLGEPFLGEIGVEFQDIGENDSRYIADCAEKFYEKDPGLID